jgi:iron complex transport system substrate-binding protein
MVSEPALSRRSFCGSLISGVSLAASPVRGGSPFSFIDVAGRTVTLPRRPFRIVLLEARDIVTMSMLHPDPASLVAGWGAVDRIDSDHLRRRFENGRRIPIVGTSAPGSISLEGLIGLAPDLVVANSYTASLNAADPFVDRLQGAGIPVAFSDTSSNARPDLQDGGPLDKLSKQLRMWGEVLDASERARALARFVESRVSRVRQRVEASTPVATYLEVQSTLGDCCWSAGRNLWGELLQFAGGRTLDGVDAPWFQKLQLEYLMSARQDVYIATGGGWSSGGRPGVGPRLDANEAREALRRLTQRTGFDALDSVRSGRVHAIWTGLITIAPLNVLFVEIVAKWLHPDLTRDIDPFKTLADLNQRFFHEPLEGPLWVSLRE